MSVTGEPTIPPATDAAVIEQSWAEPERFEAIFRRYLGQIHQYLAARVGGRIADDLAAEVFGFTITEFSVRTGKPVRVLYQRRTASEAGDTGVWWVNASGTAVIATRGPVFGVQTPTTFTPLPPKTQRLFVRHGWLFRLPAW